MIKGSQYLNSPETKVRRFHQTAQNLTIVFVEGIHVIQFNQAGIENVVSSSGQH
jgi:DNA primase